MSYIQQIAALQPILQGADHIDIKTVEGNVNLREFTCAMLRYQPAWVTFLYRVRAVFVRFLGMRQVGIPTAPRLSPADLPMTPGQKIGFFQVRIAQEDTYFVAEVADQHLKAVLGVVVESLNPHRNRFYVLTVVHYRNWAGPVYFNIIRPFHHLVVGAMARAGVQGSRAPGG